MVTHFLPHLNRDAVYRILKAEGLNRLPSSTRPRKPHGVFKDDETAASAVAFLHEAVRALPFEVTHVLTDRGSCFVADAFETACRRLKVEHRTTRPYTPKTTDEVE